MIQPHAPAVTKVWLDPCDRIGIRRIQYRCAETNDDGHLLERVDDPRIREGFTHAQFAALQDEPGYRYDPRWFAPTRQKVLLHSEVARLNDLPDDERPRVLWRWAFCQEFLRMEKLGLASRSSRDLDAVAETINEKVSKLDCAKLPPAKSPKRKLPPKLGAKPRKPRAGMGEFVRNPPSGRQLLRWIVAFEDGYDPTLLRDNLRLSGNRGLKLDPLVYDLLVKRAVEYASENRPSKDGLYEKLEGDVQALNATRAANGFPTLACPSRSRFDQEVNGLDPFQVDVHRSTPEGARRKAVIVGEGYVVQGPGRRVEMDEWEVSLMTLLIKAGVWEGLSPKLKKEVQRERWWLSVAVDCASRVVLGMRLTRNADTVGALATLHMCFLDKRPWADAVGAVTPWDMRTGILELATDTGAAYYSDAFRSAVADTGATFNNPPAGLPWLRPFIERIFSSIHTRLVSRFTGRTFENVISKGEYPAEKRASLTVDEFAWAVVRYVVDEYHNRPHEGLGGRTPRNAWAEMERDYGILALPDAQARRHAFGIRLRRAPTAEGLRLLGLYYQSEEIQKARRDGIAELDLCIDPTDLGRASVRIGDDWFEAGCRRRGLSGVSLETWIATSADLRRCYADAARMTQPVVLESIRAIERMSKAAIARAGIGASIPTAETVRRAEADLTLGFRLPDDYGDDDLDHAAPVGSSDLFAGVIAVGGQESPPQQVATREEPPRETQASLSPSKPDFEIE